MNVGMQSRQRLDWVFLMGVLIIGVVGFHIAWQWYWTVVVWIVWLLVMMSVQSKGD